ncbi:MAG TPA: hypothetical protein VL177_17545 [Terriglobales bacterium]|nr:hypothetical protein [Terriglobales bacterium]
MIAEEFSAGKAEDVIKAVKAHRMVHQEQGRSSGGILGERANELLQPGGHMLGEYFGREAGMA